MPNSAATSGKNVSPFDWIVSHVLSFKKMMTPMEDCWTWMAVDGTVYEEVIILHADSESVAFVHKYGYAAVAIANLSRDVQKSLGESLEAAGNHFLAGDLHQAA